MKAVSELCKTVFFYGDFDPLPAVKLKELQTRVNLNGPLEETAGKP